MSNNLKLLKWARDVEIEESCLKKHRIYDYEPGIVIYAFGHYPTSKPYYPTEQDWKLLDLYVEKGIGIVYVNWAWNGESGFGKDVYEPVNKEGLRRFIDECHRRSLKVIPYVSPGYLDTRSPTHRSEWSRGIGHLVEVYLDLDMFCPGSPGWRTYFFSTIERLMDDYGFDGLYCDGGMGLGRPGCANPNPDNHIHFADFSPKENGDVDHLADAVKGKINEDFLALWNEFLCEIYARVKKRDGLIVFHLGSDICSFFKEKAWDYHLLGEGVPDILKSIEKTKLYEPYVLRFNDWSRLVTNWKEKDFTPKLELVPKIEHLSMAGSIPYMQFPWLGGGNYGEEENIFNIPDIPWKRKYDVWTEWEKVLQKIGHSTIPDLVQPIYFKYLRVYKQMTKPNTVVYMEVKGMKGSRFPLTEGKRRVSVFVNDSLWVAIGNLGTDSQKVRVKSLEGKDKGETITLSHESLTVLRYYDIMSKPEILQF